MKKKALALSVLAAVSSQAGAFQFDTGEDWNIRWDNTFKGNLMARTHQASASVVDPGYGHGFPGSTERLQDDADYSVNRKNGGIVSSRVDVLSELDVIWKQDFGFRISGSGWYDAAYENSDNPKKGTLPNGLPYDYSWGMLSVKPGEYNNAAEEQAYAGGELLDAFVFGNWNIGDTALGIRAGRHTIYWGQSLLAGGALTGIAGSMAAIDIAKAYSVPGSEARELFMPDNKVSVIFQATDDLTFSGYYAFEHQVHRMPAAGTFFSPLEILTEKSEFLTVAAGTATTPRLGLRVKDDKVEESGEYGLNLSYTLDVMGGLEASLVYINGSDRSTSGIYAAPGGLDPEKQALWLQPWDEGGANARVIGQYGWVYKSDIETYGLSLSAQQFDISFGMDVTYKQDAALNPNFNAALGAGLAPTAPQPDAWSPSDYPGATGDVWGVVINGLGFLNADWGLWDGGTWIIEYTSSWLDSFGENEQLANARIRENRVTTQIGAVFRPTWYQVFPGWDLTVPMSVAYGIDGEQPPLSNVTQEEIGNASVGVEFNIKEQWNLSAKYNAFFGPTDNGTAGRVRDRDNVALTIKRTF